MANGFAQSFEKAFIPGAKAGSDMASDAIKERIKKQEEKALKEAESLRAQKDFESVRSFIQQKNPQLAEQLGSLDVTDMGTETLGTINKLLAKQVAPDGQSVGGRILMAGQSGVTQVGEYGPGDKVFREALTPEDIAARTAAGESARYAGPVQEEKRVTALRDEFQNIPTVKDFQVIKQQVGVMDDLLKKIKTGDGDSALALDQGLISTFNKVTDPTSVVRESEYERTPANIPLVNRFEGAFKKLTQGGAGLTQKDREALVFGAKVIADSRGKQYNKIVDSYDTLSKETGIKDSNKITGIYGVYEPFLSSDKSDKKTDTKSSSKSFSSLWS